MAVCTRCGYVLYRQSAVPLGGWIALTLGALVVFLIANYFPIATLALKGATVNVSFPDALALTWRQGHASLAIMTGLFGFVLPVMQLLFLLWALLAISSRRLPADFRYGMRLLDAMAPWSMVPVLMLGILVAMVKLAGLASLIIGPGLWAFGTLTFLLTGLSRLSAQRLWRHAEDEHLVMQSGDRLAHGLDTMACHSCGYVQNVHPSERIQACLRCGAKVWRRKPNAISRTWALAIAATILYIPANILPVMQIRSPVGGAVAHTILGGVVELWNMGSWGLALIVFVASVVVPMTKIFALMVLMVRREWKGVATQRQRTRLYELVEFVGQWSMLDVFVVILLAAMANFPGLSQVTAGPGAVSFGVVVILTMFAAMSFDPRQGWDRPVAPHLRETP
jgi:paraquat-inducible protein A